MEKYEENYRLGRQSTFSEGFLGFGGADKGFFMEVDEDKAVKIVKDLLDKGEKVESAELGLEGDFNENSTVIYDGEFHEYDCYYGSKWATPILIVYFKDKPNRKYESWKKQKNENHR